MQAVAKEHIVAAPVKVKNSQQAVIDQLHQQCQQNDSLIMLHGSEGCGKTTIAELFLEQASDYAECAFVTVNERATVDRMRAQILNQLFGTISLSDETLSRQIQRQTPLRHAVVVIDNGQNLPESFLAECVATVNQLSAIGQKVSMVVVADSRWAYQQKPAPHLRVQGPVMIEVQLMSTDEQVRYVQSLLPERQQRLWNFDRIQQFLSTINGYPGEIQQRLQLALATQARRYKDEPETSESFSSELEKEQVSLSSDNTSTPQRRPVRLGVLLMVAALLSAAVAGYLNKDLILAQWQALSPATTDTTDSAETANTTSPEASPQAEVQTTSETVALPSFEPLTTQSLELMPEELAISYQDALGDLNRVAASSNDPREVEVSLIAEKTPKEAPAIEPAPESKPSATNQPRAFETDVIAQRSPQNYALQIAVISTPDLLTEFRQDYGLTDVTEVYQRADGAYVIIHGNYPNIEQARASVAELPSAAQQLEPWAKSYAAMQQEFGN